MKKFNTKLIIGMLIAVIALSFVGPVNAYAATSPTLGTAGSYSVLGHTTVTNTGATTMPGDLGISIGGAPTGFPPGTVGPPGTVRNAGDSLAAQNADTAVFLALSTGANATCDTDYGAVTKELSGLTLTPGIYCADAFQLSGTLSLDASGNPNAVWIFRSALSTLNTSAGVGARVRFVTGEDEEVVGSPCNVWWKVASSATIGSGTSFVGNILALTSISMGTGASLSGRALAQTGAVTLDTNTITASQCLTASTFVPVPTVNNTASSTPKLPNTGLESTISPIELLAVGISTSIIVVLLSLAISRKRLAKN
jgi:hypothetical protein